MKQLKSMIPIPVEQLPEEEGVVFFCDTDNNVIAIASAHNALERAQKYAEHITYHKVLHFSMPYKEADKFAKVVRKHNNILKGNPCGGYHKKTQITIG